MLVSDKSFVIKATVHRQIEAGFEKEFPVSLQSDKLTDKLKFETGFSKEFSP